MPRTDRPARAAALAIAAIAVLAAPGAAGPKPPHPNESLNHGYDAPPLPGEVLWFVDFLALDLRDGEVARRNRTAARRNPLVPAPGKIQSTPVELPAPLPIVLSVRNDAGAGSFSALALPIDLHPPFRWEVTAGAIAPGGPGPGTSFFCTELDTRGSAPLDFFALCAQPSGDGFQVWVARQGENLIGLTTIPDTAALDFAIAHDGGNLDFFARPAGTGEFQEIASLPHTPYAALFPTMGASGLSAGAQIDFSAFRVVENAAPPEDAPPERTLAAQVAQGVVDLLADLAAYTGPPDPVPESLLATADYLAVTAQLLKEEAGTLEDPAAAKKAAREAKAASKLVRKVYDLASHGRPAAAVLKASWRAVQTSVGAVQRLDPHDLQNP